MDCKRCGKCCSLLGINYVDWWRSEPEYLELSKQQIQKLETERAKYPDYPNYCEMLVFEDDLAVCLIEKTMGFKPKSCREYWCKNGRE